MTPEQQEGYRSLIETHGQVGGPARSDFPLPRIIAGESCTSD
jgi:hypothetical protein